MKIEFIIPGEAVGKARPRVCGSHAFTPEKTKLYEAQVGWQYAIAAKVRGLKDFLTPPIYAIIEVYHAPPRSWSRKRREEVYGKPWTGLPDADNICKAVLDGLQGMAFRNDSEVADVFVKKRFTDCDEDKSYVRIILHDGGCFSNGEEGRDREGR